MTFEEFEKLLKDICLSSELEFLTVMPSEEAAQKREEDSKHKFVYWRCLGNCENFQVRAPTKYYCTILRCRKCKTWMEWSYKPFMDSKAQHGG